MNDQTAIKKLQEKKKKKKPKSSFGPCLCCWYECTAYIIGDSVVNLEYIWKMQYCLDLLIDYLVQA